MLWRIVRVGHLLIVWLMPWPRSNLRSSLPHAIAVHPCIARCEPRLMRLKRARSARALVSCFPLFCHVRIHKSEMFESGQSAPVSIAVACCIGRGWPTHGASEHGMVLALWFPGFVAIRIVIDVHRDKHAQNESRIACGDGAPSHMHSNRAARCDEHRTRCHLTRACGLGGGQSLARARD